MADEMIAFCGLVCTDCPAYIAHARDDQKLRRKTAREWSEEYGAEIGPEDINCTGCIRLEGVHFEHCMSCRIRACGMDRGVANCSGCDQYPCTELRKFFEYVPFAREVLDAQRG